MPDYLYVDIETLPPERDEDRITEMARAAVPANYKKPEAIDGWIEENRESIYRRGSLDWRYARILCIGFAVDEGPVEVAYTGDGNDADLAGAFARLALAQEGRKRPTWVAHNGKAFDIPYLYRNALRLRHPLAGAIPWEKWGNGIDDTMEMWCRTNPRDSARIDDIARWLNLSRKSDGLDGSMVYDAWAAGEHDRIASYCAGDVEQLREVHRHLLGHF